MTRRGRRLSVSLAGASVLAGIACFYARAEELFGWTIDDAGITYAYARHLAEGEGPVMTPGGPWVLGISNPLWMIVLAIADLLSFDIADASKALGVVFALAAGLVAALAAPLADERDRRLAPAAYGIPLVVLGLSTSFASWTFGGLENSLYALLLIASVGFDLLEHRDPYRPPWSAVTLALACMTRPEAPLYVACFGALKLVDAARSRAHRRFLVRFGVTVGLLVGGQYLLQYVIFGAAFPNTFVAKQSPDGAFLPEPGLAYIQRAIEEDHVLVLAPVLLLGWPRRGRAGASILAVLIPALFFVVYARGDWMPRHRFLSWTFPILGLLALLSVRRALGWIADGRTARTAVGAAMLVVLGVSGLRWYEQRTAFFTEQGVVTSCMYCSVLRQSRDVDRAAHELGLRHYSVVVMDLGGFAYRTSPRVFAVDWAGLCDRSLGLMARRLRTSDTRPTLADQERRQYLFHELAEPPTLVHLTPHFWSAAPNIIEVRQSYFRLSTARYGMPARLFLLHRSRYIDYFPDVDRIDPRPLGALRVIGSSCRDDRVRVAITRADADASPPEAITLRVDGTAQRVRLFEECPECRAQWELGEPYVVDAAVPVGARHLAVEVDDVRVRVCPSGPSRRPSPDLEPFVRNLPPPASARMRTLARRVRAHLRERDLRADYRVHASELADELVEVAEAARDEDERYLAWVLAAQADPAVDRASAPVLFSLRPRRSTHRFTATLTALRRAYAGTDADVRRAAALFASLGDEDALHYLRARRPDLDERTIAASMPAPPVGIDGDFERSEVEGWSTRGFSSQEAMPGDHAFPVTGHRGARVLASFGPRTRWERAAMGTGEARSAPIEIDDAAVLSLWLGGIGHARVELLADDEVVHEAVVALATELQPHEIDLAELGGRTVQLRVVDEDAASAVAVDTIRLWPMPR